MTDTPPPIAAPPSTPPPSTRAADTWFADAALGVMITWDHSSTQGWEISWQMVGNVEGMPYETTPVGCDEYFANAATFNPTEFDADRWAQTVAAAGATYVVFITKHHAGFALFDTAQSDYSIVRGCEFGRDVLAELVAALRRHDLRVGLYFSIVDWHHPDYPRYTDEIIEKPYVVGRYPRSTEAQWERFHAFMVAQLTELLTNYGPIDVLWFDGEFEHSAQEWDYAGLRALVAELQPDCLVNDRLVGFGDFRTPEQQLPEHPPEGPWEICMTMTDRWSYSFAELPWKSPRQLISTLAETLGGGGNLLIGIGPDGAGRFPPETTQRLAAFGEWTRANREAVYGVQRGLSRYQSPLPTSRRPSADGGEQIFVYLTMMPVESYTVRQLPVQRVESVRVLGSGTELSFSSEPALIEVQHAATDPLGEVVIDVSGMWADGVGVDAPIVPVLAITIAPLTDR